MSGPRRIELRKLEMPQQVRAQASRLLAATEISESKQALHVAAPHAEEFVLGLESSSFHVQVTEVLYFGFETSAAECEKSLGDN